MGDIRRLSSLIFHIPVYGPGALTRALQPEDDMVQRELTMEDMEAMHPGLFGAN